MAKRGFEVTAVDVRSYSQTHENVKFVQADITTLPFSAESFDTITCISTIEQHELVSILVIRCTTKATN